jgi:hypothetical protein
LKKIWLKKSALFFKDDSFGDVWQFGAFLLTLEKGPKFPIHEHDQRKIPPKSSGRLE